MIPENGSEGSEVISKDGSSEAFALGLTPWNTNFGLDSYHLERPKLIFLKIE
jgi:hypothetical protein